MRFRLFHTARTDCRKKARLYLGERNDCPASLQSLPSIVISCPDQLSFRFGDRFGVPRRHRKESKGKSDKVGVSFASLVKELYLKGTLREHRIDPVGLGEESVQERGFSGSIWPDLGDHLFQPLPLLPRELLAGQQWMRGGSHEGLRANFPRALLLKCAEEVKGTGSAEEAAVLKEGPVFCFSRLGRAPGPLLVALQRLELLFEPVDLLSRSSLRLFAKRASTPRSGAIATSLALLSVTSMLAATTALQGEEASVTERCSWSIFETYVASTMDPPLFHWGRAPTGR